MSKGDRVGVKTSGGETLEVIAEQAGRTVEYEFKKDGLINWLVIRVITRGGTVVRENHIPSSEVAWMTVTKKEIV